MKRRQIVVLVASTLTALFITEAANAASAITVISWGGAVQKAEQAALFEPFTKSTGIKIVQGEYNGELAKIKAMVDTKQVTWDVVDVLSVDLHRGCDEGLFERLDFSKIGNKSDLLPTAVSDCGVGSYVGATVFAYNADKIKQAPQTWSDFWNVEKFPGKRGVRKAANGTLEIALLADGVKPDDIYKVLATTEGQQRAFKKLDQLKPSIQWWESGAQPAQWLVSGDVSMSVAWNGRITAAQKEGRNLKIVWAENVYDVGFFAIPKGTPNLTDAYKFISFSTSAPQQVAFSSLIPYGPTNKTAIAKITPADAAELPTAPAHMKGALPADPAFWAEHGEELEQRFNAWAAR